ncbi:N-acetyllactosaminide 3-alpha-galactosyltransferase [Cooperia oncophora]
MAFGTNGCRDITTIGEALLGDACRARLMEARIMGNFKAAGTIPYMFSLSRLRRYFTLLMKFAVVCAVFGSCFLIYNGVERVPVFIELFEQTINNQYYERYSRQLAVDRTNVRMWRLHMKQSFLDPRLSPINCSIVPRVSVCAEVDFVVVVHVRADDDQSRTDWRNTYGAGQLRRKYNYTLLFSVGRPGSLHHQKIIEEESALYDDILQFDFNDTYRNLTLKHLAELRYLASACDGNVVLLKWTTMLDGMFNGFPISRRITSPLTNFTVLGVLVIYRFETQNRNVVKRMLDVVHLQRFFWIDDVSSLVTSPRSS